MRISAGSLAALAAAPIAANSCWNISPSGQAGNSTQGAATASRPCSGPGQPIPSRKVPCSASSSHGPCGGIAWPCGLGRASRGSRSGLASSGSRSRRNAMRSSDRFRPANSSAGQPYVPSRWASCSQKSSSWPAGRGDGRAVQQGIGWAGPDGLAVAPSVQSQAPARSVFLGIVGPRFAGSPFPAFARGPEPAFAERALPLVGPRALCSHPALRRPVGEGRFGADPDRQIAAFDEFVVRTNGLIESRNGRFHGTHVVRGTNWRGIYEIWRGGNGYCRSSAERGGLVVRTDGLRDRWHGRWPRFRYPPRRWLVKCGNTRQRYWPW